MMRASNPSTLHRQAGLTMLELMISLSLGLLLLTGIGTIYVGSNQTYRVQEQNARIQESGRFALDVIGRGIRQAGYWNMPIDPNNLKNCLGYDTTTIPPTCNATPVTGTANRVTVQYDGTGAVDCSGAVVAAGTIVTEAIDLNANNLRCNTAPLVSNVEALQFLYGIDTTLSSTASTATRYVAAPADWSRVVSVRACVLIRSEDQGITATAQRYLNCDGALATGATAFTTAGANDRRLRRVFMATFNLRNRTP